MPERIRESIAADVREAMDPAVEERLNLTGQIPNFGGLPTSLPISRNSARGSAARPRTSASSRRSEVDRDARPFGEAAGRNGCRDLLCSPAQIDKARLRETDASANENSR
jgi:hypothetical protein